VIFFGITLLLLFISDFCFARAGGGGGETVGVGILISILAFILAPFFLVYSVIVSIKLSRRRNQVKQLTEQLSKGDRLWNYRAMMARVEQVFFKVQKAWMERNQDLAKDCMSNRIYQKHKLQTDEMIANGTKNMLAKMNLKEIMIINVADYKDNSEDTFSVYVKGSMIDYTINDKTNAVISGDSMEPENFEEIWTFVREGNVWMLDEIDQNVSLGGISRSKAFSETKLD
jgi:predicted lipid-binding transport protein (Tim44 family)